MDGKSKVASVTGSQKDELESRPGALLNLLTFGPKLNFPLTVGKQWSRELQGHVRRQQQAGWAKRNRTD
jgi:hypothetical protein